MRSCFYSKMHRNWRIWATKPDQEQKTSRKLSIQTHERNQFLRNTLIILGKISLWYTIVVCILLAKCASKLSWSAFHDWPSDGHCQTVNFDGVHLKMRLLQTSSVLFTRTTKLVVTTEDKQPGPQLVTSRRCKAWSRRQGWLQWVGSTEKSQRSTFGWQHYRRSITRCR